MYRGAYKPSQRTFVMLQTFFFRVAILKELDLCLCIPTLMQHCNSPHGFKQTVQTAPRSERKNLHLNWSGNCPCCWSTWRNLFGSERCEWSLNCVLFVSGLIWFTLHVCWIWWSWQHGRKSPFHWTALSDILPCGKDSACLCCELIACDTATADMTRRNRHTQTFFCPEEGSKSKICFWLSQAHRNVHLKFRFFFRTSILQPFSVE